MAVSDHSVWRDTELPKLEPLTESLDADIAIIGGGMTGVVAAYLLSTTAKSVVLLDGTGLGAWATGSTTAFLMEYLDTEPSPLIERYGFTAASRITAAHRDAISWFESTIREEKIDCDFVRCSATVFGTSKDRDELQKDHDALKQLGTDAAMHPSAPTFTSGSALEIKNQAKFHPLKFLRALAEKAQQNGVVMYQAKVLQVAGASPVIVTCETVVVRAQKVLMATQYPLDPQPEKLAYKKAWYDTYVLAAELPKGTVLEGLYEDTANPYHYMRLDAGDETDRLILGGEDHRSDVPVDSTKAYAALEQFLKETLPGTRYTLTNRWKGGIVEPGDGIAMLGSIDGGPVFYATGYSGNGMTYAVIAARMFAAYSAGDPNPYPEFAADRSVSMRAYLPKALEYIQEFIVGVFRLLLGNK